MKRVVIIVQARMGSTRLPEKSLKEIAGKPLLGYVLQRLKRVKSANEIVVATTIQPKDDILAQFCQSLNIPVWRGSEEDVLSRYGEAAQAFHADVIVRISGDCPLIDPEIVEQAISLFQTGHYDYVSNVIQRTYPRGMDVEVFSRKALNQALVEAKAQPEREHVTPYFYRHPELFKLGNLEQTSDQSDYRLTVDTKEDLELITRIIKKFPDSQPFVLKDIIAVLTKHPEWLKLNSHIQQKAVL